MRDRSGAEAGLVGERRAAKTPDDGFLQDNTGSRAADGLRIESGGEDLAERGDDIICVENDNGNAKNDVQKRHSRDKLFRDSADALDAAEEDDADEDSQNDAEDEVQHAALSSGGRDERVDSVVDGADDGVDLRHVADTESGDGCKDTEQDADPLPALAEAVLDVVHRAADPVALRVALTVLDCEQNFGVLDHHAKQGSQPEPEDGAVAAEGDGLGGTNDVAGADRSRQRRGDSLHRRDCAFACLLFLEHFTQCVLHHVAELRELKTTVADGQIKTKEDGARQEDVQPCYSVKGTGDKTNDCLHRFCLRTIPRSSILS